MSQRRRWCSLLVLTGSLSAPAALAEGGVAVAVTLPDKSAVHRDFAAGMVSEAHDRFAMLTPQLTPEEVSRCQTDEACLLSLAKARDASHLLLVGVASLGPSEYVVALRVLDVVGGAEVVNVSDLAEPGGDPALAGRALAGRAFTGVVGLPAKSASTTNSAASGGERNSGAGPVSEDKRALGWTGTSPLSLVGWGVAGLATLGAGAGLLIGISLFTANQGAVQTYSIFTGASVASAFAVGLGLVAADAYLLNGE